MIVSPATLPHTQSISAETLEKQRLQQEMRESIKTYARYGQSLSRAVYSILPTKAAESLSRACAQIGHFVKNCEFIPSELAISSELQEMSKRSAFNPFLELSLPMLIASFSSAPIFQVFSFLAVSYLGRKVTVLNHLDNRLANPLHLNEYIKKSYVQNMALMTGTSATIISLFSGTSFLASFVLEATEWNSLIPRLFVNLTMGTTLLLPSIAIGASAAYGMMHVVKHFFKKETAQTE